MMKLRLLTVILFALVAFIACKPTEKPEKHIAAFLAANKINAIKDSSGLYYEVIKQGNGTFTYPENTQITIMYEGRLLNGELVDDGGGTEQTFKLSELIQGWRIGIPKIQKGGEIRLIIPPGLGYGNSAAGPIPGNSVLDFRIKLIDVQ